MKKSELKTVLKPLIKECIKEVIFEEGILSNIISEVVQGMGAAPLVEREEKRLPRTVKQQPQQDELRLKERKNKLAEARKRMLGAINKDAYNGVNLFEGTEPAPSPSTSHGRGPLDNEAPSDPGVDISGIFSDASSTIWKKLSGK